MAPNELIDRYIYAATKRIPQRKSREDIALELRTLIDDMLTERCGGKEPEEKDVRVIITEIGTPAEVYHKYSPDADKALLSGDYYVTCKYLLKIVIPCVFFSLIIANIVLIFTGSSPSVLSFFLNFIGMTVPSLCGVFTAFIIIFAVMERKKVSIGVLETELDFNALPPVPKKHEMISRAECIFDIVLNVLFIIIFIFAPQIIAFIDVNGIVPMFNISRLHELWYLVAALGAIGIFDNILRLSKGRYTLKVLISSLVTNALTLILSVILFMPSAILNPDFTAKIQAFFAGFDFKIGVLQNFNLIFLGLIVFAVIIDTAENVYRYFKFKK